ncbi:response regulator receiver domain [Aliiglaciecola lipolytica]|uniref:response regulator receiver domain n=1 Tax=Aliiglaciecola lipolytica TaxID=477689 RepID=UPI001C080756|nr:response regulator receiver domain [Aliiglaciecola lipolytica]MBU2877446.1 hypothetical protein [Aliiglaciecola lipolytica]
MTPVLSFKENSKMIAQHFLQSVVAVDDNIRFKARPAFDDEKLAEPDDTGFGEFEADDDKQQATTALSHELYYQDLSHEFASKGIICGGFSPEGDVDSSLQAVVNTSKNADITILDWQMEKAGPDGKFAIDTTLKISEIDISEGGRTRLICIYTAENAEDVADILVKSLVGLHSKLEERTITFELPELTHWKIEVVNKADKLEVELCDFLINSFANLTTGLLSNAVVSSIASIRDNTHNLLHKFNSTLDPAYVSHILGLISSPKMREQAHDVAFDYAVELISEELKSSLQINEKVKGSLSKKIINAWPDFIEVDDLKKSFFLELSDEEKLTFNRTQMKRLLLADDLKETLKEIGMEASQKNIVASQKAKRLLASESNQEKIDPILNSNNAIQVKHQTLKPIERFEREAIQLSINEPSEKPLLDLCSIENTRRSQEISLCRAPSLKQGTILKNEKTSEYYICIQPLCDSVRLQRTTSFTFLQISEVTEKKGKFTHVIKKANNEHLKLFISCKATTVRTLDFLPDTDSKVVLSFLEDRQYFFENSTNIRFEWYGELKQLITQDIVNNLAAQISRVGSDSFEWLRQKQL